MAKFKLKKPSKRQPARRRYKILKKIREHNRKIRKDAKKNPKGNKQQVVQIPNICPFKENILKEVEEMKKLKEDERQKQREQAKLEREKRKDEAKSVSLETLAANAEMRGKIHENLTPQLSSKVMDGKQENSLKAYYKEFRKVVEAADVILEVVDARDPLGTRCLQVEQVVKDMKGNKRLVLVLNKADLVPRKILDQWLKYLKKSVPAIAFKASTQDQSRRLGQKKFTKAEQATKGSSCVGAEILMSLLANYCRNKGIKTSITVGIVGLPNVGKSSIINSLKRTRACNVGAAPGVTKAMQEVQLDSKIKLLDSPGIVFASGSDSSACLRNSLKVASLADPITPANAILQRVGKQQMMEMYDVTEFDTPEEFYAKKAARMGRFRKGGVPDSSAAARSLLEDWNSGKIRYYTVPPEDDAQVHISAALVTEVAKEFDLDAVEAIEAETLDRIEKEVGTIKSSFVLESLGPVEQMEEDEAPGTDLLSKEIAVGPPKKTVKKVKSEISKKPDPEMELEGNQKLNQIKKKQFKKEKKMRNRREKVAVQLASGLENFSITNEKKADDYNFDEDYAM